MRMIQTRGEAGRCNSVLEAERKAPAKLRIGRMLRRFQRHRFWLELGAFRLFLRYKKLFVKFKVDWIRFFEASQVHANFRWFGKILFLKFHCTLAVFIWNESLLFIIKLLRISESLRKPEKPKFTWINVNDRERWCYRHLPNQEQNDLNPENFFGHETAGDASDAADQQRAG